MKVKVVIYDEHDRKLGEKEITIDEDQSFLAITEHQGVTDRYASLFDFIELRGD